MKYDIPEYVDVHCTETDKTVEAMIIRQSQTELVVDINGIHLKLLRQGRVYVGYMVNMEFIVKF